MTIKAMSEITVGSAAITGGEDLFIPDRFDMLKRKADDKLQTIVVPVDDALQAIDLRRRGMRAAGRGGFMVVRGDSGSGKSTFLHTLNLFRENHLTLSIERSEEIGSFLQRLDSANCAMRVLVIEGREALRDTDLSELEAALHDINSFLRTDRGENTMVAWPCNADDLQNALIDIASRIGGDALLGTGEPYIRFQGPPKEQYLDIGQRTVATLNQGASIHDLGVSEENAQEFIESSPTVGSFMGRLREALLQNLGEVDDHLKKERCRLWVVVIAGNDPDNDVAALTRGNLSTADIDRLLSATQANVVEELRRYPEKIGIISAALDAKILHVPVLAALAAARSYHNGGKLKGLMEQANLSTARDNQAKSRIESSELGLALLGGGQGTRTRGPKIGSNTIDAFEKLVDIASNDDQALNAALGNALVDTGRIMSFLTEQDLGNGLIRRTDILAKSRSGPIRLEIMWRKKAGRADIANYTLTKLFNYGRAIGYLE